MNALRRLFGSFTGIASQASAPEASDEADKLSEPKDVQMTDGEGEAWAPDRALPPHVAECGGKSAEEHADEQSARVSQDRTYPEGDFRIETNEAYNTRMIGMGWPWARPGGLKGSQKSKRFDLLKACRGAFACPHCSYTVRPLTSNELWRLSIEELRARYKGDESKPDRRTDCLACFQREGKIVPLVHLQCEATLRFQQRGEGTPLVITHKGLHKHPKTPMRFPTLAEERAIRAMERDSVDISGRALSTLAAHQHSALNNLEANKRRIRKPAEHRATLKASTPTTKAKTVTRSPVMSEAAETSSPSVAEHRAPAAAEHHTPAATSPDIVPRAVPVGAVSLSTSRPLPDQAFEDLGGQVCTCKRRQPAASRTTVEERDVALLIAATSSVISRQATAAKTRPPRTRDVRGTRSKPVRLLTAGQGLQ